MFARVRQTGPWIAAVLIALIVLFAIWLLWIVRRPFPQHEGVVDLPGLQAEVTIRRDAFGVAHIYAENEHDLFLAQGYVHAQDRFWQMEFWRHIGQGRISEIVGEAGLESDKFIRTVGWNRIGEETLAFYAAEAPEFVAILEAYSAGVNAYIAEQGDNISVNYTILSTVNDAWEIEPWTPVNTITWGVVMAHDLSGNRTAELRRARLLEALGDEQMVAGLYPDYPNDRPVIVPTGSGVQETAALSSPLAQLQTSDIEWASAEKQLIGREPAAGFAFGAHEFVGSNNWVVSGRHTNTGMPLLANDPHLSIQMPSIWYEVGLHAPDYNVVGFSFAGVPGVIVGHNNHIAWGVTNMGPDVQDHFIERLNPENPDQYEFMGEWRDVETVEEVIKVNGGDDVVLSIRKTHHGPIISDVLEGTDEVLAFSWTALEPSRVLQAVIMANRSEDYADFREAMRFWDVPGQNFVYADTEGNIAYQSTGRIPIRQSGDGRLPVPGWTGEYEWMGWIPFEEMPALFNPPEGFIVTANHAIVDDAYPYLISTSWADGDRGERITELIEAHLALKGEITAEDFAEIQMDSQDLVAETFVPLLLALNSDDPQVQAAIEALDGWDYQLRRDSVAAAIYSMTYHQLVGLTCGDELGERAEDYVGHGAQVRIFMRGLADQPDAAWWDDVTTAGTIETRDDILLAALQSAVVWLEENHGSNMDDWTWGALHQATFVSAPLGQSGVGPLESLVNRGEFPVDGGTNMVNAVGWDWDEPARVNWHPSMRMIVDMADFEASQTIIPTGQSGHPGHDHYDDMIELWVEGEFHPMWFGETAVTEATLRTLVLRPSE